MGKKHELLIDDGQLLILETRLAVLVGDRQAIALQQIHYWIEINRKADKDTHFFDRRWWVYNTWNEWNRNDFPFWSVRTIRRVFDDLARIELLTTRAHIDRNKGLWVTIDYDKLHGLTKTTDGYGQNGQTGMAKMDRPNGQNGQTLSTTENNTETTSKTTTKEHPALNSAAIIDTWLKTQDAIKPNAFKIKHNHELARALITQGITSQDIKEYICWRRSDEFWNKFLSLEHVAENIIVWKRNNAPPPVEPVDAGYTGEDVVIIPDGYFDNILKRG